MPGSLSRRPGTEHGRAAGTYNPYYRGIMEESIDFDELARFLKQSALAMVRAEGRGSGG
ncbi:MAG: hypothetical protein H5T74_14375 [Actinobacteria bacterium]|nr:hypothetical protein [Actinomycetota bacterium]